MTQSASHPLSDTPLVSVITITRNHAQGLSRTLASIALQTYAPIELVVIDGASTDDTASVINAHKQLISKHVSEPDQGIYDAMNKGLSLATGQWVIFMNAGDCFASAEALAAAMSVRTAAADVIYSDAWFGEQKQLASCSHDAMRIIHQSLIYKRDLHQQHGSYVVMKGMTISDYLFFTTIRHRQWVKSPVVIAHCEKEGVSSDKNAYYQKLAVDQIAGLRGPMMTAVMMLLYPIYRIFLRPVVRLLRPTRI